MLLPSLVCMKYFVSEPSSLFGLAIVYNLSLGYYERERLDIQKIIH